MKDFFVKMKNLFLQCASNNLVCALYSSLCCITQTSPSYSPVCHGDNVTITCTGNGSAVLWHPSDSAPATVVTVPNIIVQLGMSIFDVIVSLLTMSTRL